MFTINNLESAKSAAKKISNRLERENIKISHSLSLELISAVIGHRNWNITSFELSKKQNLCENLFGNRKKVTEVILENTVQHLSKENSILDNICRLIIKVIPNLLANDIVGVQAITTPIGAVQTLRIGYTKSHKIICKLLEETVETKTKQMSVLFDFKKCKEEEIDVLANEIINQHDQELLWYLHNIADTPSSIYKESEDNHKELVLLINRQANMIGARTRRGVGNWIVVSPTILTFIESSGFLSKTPNERKSKKYVGALSSGIDVYCDPYANDSILVGYNGNTPEDSPVIYSPYLPILPGDQNGLYTQYGFTEIQKSQQFFGDAKDYITSIKIQKF